MLQLVCLYHYRSRCVRKLRARVAFAARQRPPQRARRRTTPWRRGDAAVLCHVLSRALPFFYPVQTPFIEGAAVRVPRRRLQRKVVAAVGALCPRGVFVGAARPALALHAAIVSCMLRLYLRTHVELHLRTSISGQAAT